MRAVQLFCQFFLILGLVCSDASNTATASSEAEEAEVQTKIEHNQQRLPNVDKMQVNDFSDLLIYSAFLIRTIISMVSGIPQIFYGYRFLSYTIALLAFSEGMQNTWEFLSSFYSTTQKQQENGVSYNTIGLTSICIGIVMCLFAFKFRRFACIFGGVIFGIVQTDFTVDVMNSFRSHKLYTEITYPLTILLVFVFGLAGFSGSPTFQVFATAFIGSTFLFRSIRQLVLFKIYGEAGTEAFGLLWLAAIIVMLSTMFGVWIQNKLAASQKERDAIDLEDGFFIQEEELPELVPDSTQTSKLYELESKIKEPIPEVDTDNNSISFDEEK